MGVERMREGAAAAWRAIAGIGTARAASPAVAQRIRTVNQYAVIAALLAVPYLPIFRAIGSEALGNGIVLVLAVYAAIVALNHAGRHDASRMVMVLFGPSVVGFYSLALGLGAQIHLMLMVCSCVPFLIYSPDEGRLGRLVGLSYPPVVWLALHHVDGVAEVAVLSSAAQDRLATVMIPTSFALVTSVVLVFHAECARSERELRSTLTTLHSEMARRLRAQAEVERAHHRITELAHRSGMAEVAAGVVHDLGNALNAAFTGAAAAAARIRELRVERVAETAELLRTRGTDLGRFLSEDPRGAKLPEYMVVLADRLRGERQAALDEHEQLACALEDLHRLVSDHQAYANAIEHRQAVQVATVVREIVDEHRELPLDRPVAISFAGGSGSTIGTDRLLFRSIVATLVRHCLAAAARGSTAPEVLVTVADERDAIRIVFRHGGAGFDDERLATVFAQDARSRAEAGERALHRAYLQATRIGGALSVASEGPDRGATFVLTLPASATAGEPLGSEACADRPRKTG